MRTALLASLVVATIATATETRAATLYDQLGARPGLEKIVATATQIFVADPRIGATFEDTNLDRFKQKLFEQLCQVADGGCTYTGRSMRDSHKGLHLGTGEFNILVEDLQRALDQNDVPFHVQNRLIALLAPMYRDVVTK